MEYAHQADGVWTPIDRVNDLINGQSAEGDRSHSDTPRCSNGKAVGDMSDGDRLCDDEL